MAQLLEFASPAAAGSSPPPSLTQEPLRPPAVVFSSRQSLPEAALPPDADSRTAERVMREVTQVHPVEEPEPEGLRASLRPAVPEQSLAFMLKMEPAPEDELLLGERAAHQWQQATMPQHAICGGWFAEETGMGKTCVWAFLLLAQPTPALSSTADLAELRRRTRDVSQSTFIFTIKGEKYEGSGSKSSFHEPSKYLHLGERHQPLHSPLGYWARNRPEVVKPNPKSQKARNASTPRRRRIKA